MLPRNVRWRDAVGSYYTSQCLLRQISDASTSECRPNRAVMNPTSAARVKRHILIATSLHSATLGHNKFPAHDIRVPNLLEDVASLNKFGTPVCHGAPPRASVACTVAYHEGRGYSIFAQRRCQAAAGQGQAAPLFGQAQSSALASVPQRSPRDISGRTQRPWDATTRNPMLLFELSGLFLLRSLTRAFL